MNKKNLMSALVICFLTQIIFFYAQAQTEVAGSLASGTGNLSDIRNQIMNSSTETGNVFCSYGGEDYSNAAYTQCKTTQMIGGRTADGSEYCIVEKIKCYHVSTGWFEWPKAELLLWPGESCTTIDLNTTLKRTWNEENIEISFIGDH